MNYNNNHYINLLLLVITMYLIFPSPFQSSQFLLYPLTSITIVLLIIGARKVHSIEIDNVILLFVSFLIILSILITFSILFNQENVSISSIIHSIKPIFFVLILIFSYLFSIGINKSVLFSKISRMALFLLIFQLLVGSLQAMNFPLINEIYNSEKVTGIGGKLRVVGTLNNPNILAWTVSQLAVIMILFEKRKILKIVGIAIAVILIILSGSRSFIVLLPIIISFVYLFKSLRSVSRIFLAIPIFLVAILSSLKIIEWFIYRYQHIFPYLSQLTNVFETGDLRSVNSFNLRISIWENGLERLGNSWLFGVGPNTIKYGLDNDYLYALINYGLVYLIIQTAMYLLMLIWFLNYKDRNIRMLGLQAILFSFVISFQADTISGWFYPILILFYLGISVGMLTNSQKE